MGAKEETQKESAKDDKNRVTFDSDNKEAKMEEGKASEKKPMPKLPKPLTIEEKKYLLSVERGDNNTVRKMLQKTHRHPEYMNKNCVDPLGRGALHMAVDNENLEMLELLVVMGVDTKDALLHAIDVEFVEAVEVLLEHEEVIHKEGESYSWEKVDRETASFTPEITPLILAAHRDNYEILKILLDRGAMLPMPHDIRCGCEDCIRNSSEDSLRHSMSRINSYRALASPSLIALSSTDPILTAFELSWELKNLAYDEQEFRSEYFELRRQCRNFAEELLNHTRSSTELAVILNYDPESLPYEEGEHMELRRLELAVDYKQKKFVAHANVQQLLAAIWYEGLPGFRRMSTIERLQQIVKLVAFFPLYCMHYMIMPESPTGKLMRTPFMKFLIHSASYLFFLLLLILVSVRFEDLVIVLFGTEGMKTRLEERRQIQRGNLPTPTECFVFIYVFGFIWEEVLEMKNEGIKKYFKNMWNLLDVLRDSLYIMTILLRTAAFIQQSIEISNDPQTAYIRKENWDTFDPQLISEGLFSAANILSALKLVHIFSINPYLGPLQISLGRMVIDIVKFFFIYSLVLFAFACGLTQLLWYYNDLEKKKCYSLPGGLADWNKQGDACMKWRRFHNVFEASQSLFWAGFGMVGLSDFELTGIREYTRFWSMLMFGTYSVINIIVLLNLLIAMMSNSYSFIVEHADTEWKFARTKLWMSYFEEGKTLPPPFNIMPNIKLFRKYVLKTKEPNKAKRMSTRTQRVQRKARDYRYLGVMRALIWRYVCSLQKRNVESPVTEDDINEVKGDISSLRFELIDLFENNGMDVSNCSKKSKAALGRKMKMWERRLMRDFHVSPAMGGEGETDTSAAPPTATDKDKANVAGHFKRIAKLAMTPKIADVAVVVAGKAVASQIGRTQQGDDAGRENLKKAMERARLKMEEDTPDNSPGSSRGCSPFPDLYTGPHLLDTINSLQLSPLASVAPSPMPMDGSSKLPPDAEAKDHNLLTIPGRRSASKSLDKGNLSGEMSLNVPSDVFSVGVLKSMMQDKMMKTNEEAPKDGTADASSKIPQVTVSTVSEKNTGIVKKSEEQTQTKSSNGMDAKDTKIEPKKPEPLPASENKLNKPLGGIPKKEDSNLNTKSSDKPIGTPLKSENPLQPPKGRLIMPQPKEASEVKREFPKPSPLRIDLQSACFNTGESYGVPRAGPQGLAVSPNIHVAKKDLPPATPFSKQQPEKNHLQNSEVIRKPRLLSKQYSEDKLDGVKPPAPHVPKQPKPSEATKPNVECSDKAKNVIDKSDITPAISVIPSTPCGPDTPKETRKQMIETNKNDSKSQKEIPKPKIEAPVKEVKPKVDLPQETNSTKIPQIVRQSSKDKQAPEPVKQPAKIEKVKETSAPLPPKNTQPPKSQANMEEKKTPSTKGKKGGWL